MKLNLQNPLAFFDLETTGMNVVKDRIVEICIIKIMPDGSSVTKHDLINPTIPIPKEVTEIHGISDKDVVDKPTFAQVAQDYSSFIEKCDMAGFNSNKFDVPLLAEEFARVGIDFEIKGRRFIDIQNIFHKMEPRNLSAAYKFYCNKDLENAHTAEADARATYEIMLAQIQRYQDVDYKDKDGKISKPVQNDVKKLSEFSFYNKNADLVGQIVFDKNNVEVFNFGKNKGKSVESVFKAEPQYYDWMMKSDFPNYTKKVITAIRLRALSTKQ
ncbi:MAG: 3'-5' exonuclease [Bacteroidales bacterium]|nr:3'-5' exonuclease [Bacteroidales bacterium]MDY0217720.1 3'-5' exonuclease [Bacteroidales bacterium]